MLKLSLDYQGTVQIRFSKAVKKEYTDVNISCKQTGKRCVMQANKTKIKCAYWPYL